MKISEIFRFPGLTAAPRFNGRTIADGGVAGPDGTLHPLRPQSLHVLELLALHAGEPVSKRSLFDTVWPDTAVTDDSLTQCIADIRRAIGDSDRRVLETLPRHGFCLHRDRTGTRRWRPAATALLLVLGLGALLATMHTWRAPASATHIATLDVEAATGAEAMAAEVSAALDTYSGVRRVSGPARFRLDLSRPMPRMLLAELTDTETSAIIMTRSIPASDDGEALRLAGVRLAASVASLRSGAIAETMFPEIRRKPLADLTEAECYLHYGQMRGGAFTDKVVARTRACLERIVDRAPENARALALLAATEVEQYWYGEGLDPPVRDDLNLRGDFAKAALTAAQAAEAAGLPADPEVHLAIATAYYGSCKKDQMITAFRRAMELRPDDPTILGMAGNYIAYAGDWDTGVPLARRAIDIAGADYEWWWYWALGKGAWIRGDYEAALDAFMRGYEESNWHTMLHLAYTLPYLGRDAEAHDAVARLQEIWPGFTRADARLTHRRWCFEDTFIEKMDAALARAGLADGPPETSTVARSMDPPHRP